MDKEMIICNCLLRKKNCPENAFPAKNLQLPPLLLVKGRVASCVFNMAMFLYIVCGRCPHFSFSTYKKCMLSHFIHNSTARYVSIKTLYPGGIRTRVFLFLRQMQCPLRPAARATRDMLRFFKYLRNFFFLKVKLATTV
jgi:hypothetical protein